MGVFLKVNLDDGATREALRRLRVASVDLRAPMRAIGRASVNATRVRFSVGRTPEGASWKKGVKTKGQTLIASGLLRNSINSQLLSPSTVVVGSNKVYSRIHQFGGTITSQSGRALRFSLNGGSVVVRRVTMPARPYLGVSRQDGVDFVAIMHRYLAGALKGNPART